MHNIHLESATVSVVMSDETRLALRRACIENNVRALTEPEFIDDVDLHRFVNTRAVLERYDRGEPIGG